MNNFYGEKRNGKNWRKTYADEDARLVRIHKSIKTRCFNKNVKCYAHYGGRGITVCDEWLGINGGLNFIKWAKENGYRDDLTIDRIDVDKGYSPDNCRWATWNEQRNNTTRSIRIIIGSEILSPKEVSVRYGIPVNTVRARYRMGWPSERIIENYNHNYLPEREEKLICKVAGGNRNE